MSRNAECSVIASLPARSSVKARKKWNLMLSREAQSFLNDSRSYFVNSIRRKVSLLSFRVAGRLAREVYHL